MDPSTDEARVTSPSTDEQQLSGVSAVTGEAEDALRRAAREFADVAVHSARTSPARGQVQLLSVSISPEDLAAKDALRSAAGKFADVAVHTARTSPARGQVQLLSVSSWIEGAWKTIADGAVSAAEAFADFGEDAVDEIADVTVDVANGAVKEVVRLGNGLVELVYNRVHVANNTEYEVRVAVSPNPDFAIADAACAVASEVAFLVATSYAGGVPTTIKTFGDLKKLFSVLSTAGSIASPAMSQLIDLFEKTTIKIPSREVGDVVVKPLYNPLDYLGASGWGAITGAHEMHLAVYLYDPVPPSKILHKVEFNTNSDTSWSVHDLGVVRGLVRVARGAIWNPEPNKKWE